MQEKKVFCLEVSERNGQSQVFKKSTDMSVIGCTAQRYESTLPVYYYYSFIREWFVLRENMDVWRENMSSKYTTPPVKMIDDRWAGLLV